MNIPEKIYAGDKIEWTDSLSDYPASNGYTLIYILNGMNNRIQIESTNDGDNYKFEISSNITKNWVAGWYKWQAVIKYNGERATISTGKIEIIENLELASGTDGRSIWQVAIDNLEEVIKKKSTEGYETISVITPSGTSRQIGKMSWSEILSALSYAKRQLSIEQNGGKKKRILARFE